MSWSQLALPLLLVVPAIGALVLLLAGSRSEKWAVPFGLIVQGIGLLIALAVLGGFDTESASRMQFAVSHEWVPQLGMSLRLGVDGISLPLVVLTSLLGFLTMVYSLRYFPKGGSRRAFVGLLLLLQVGMLGTFVSLDLIVFFVFFEIVLAPMWFLIAFWGQGERRAAANTFILYTVLGSVVMLLGFLLVWVRTGTTDMVTLASIHGAGLGTTVQLAAALLIVVGLAVKAPAWPLHSWLPDAHTAAPTVGSVLLAGVLLKMGTYGMVRIALPVVPEGFDDIAPYLAAFAVVGILYGAWASFGQRDLKRLIAFSSVGHMGFVLLGIATVDAVGVNGALFGNIAHGLITGLLFFLVGGIKERTNTTEIRRMPRGLYHRAPWLGFLFGFACVASLGLPGLAGFWGEFLALVGAYSPAVPAHMFYRILMVLAAIGVVLTAAYFLRIMRRIGQGEGPPTALRDLTAIESAAWLPLAALILVLGLLPGLLLNLTNPAVQQIVSTSSGSGSVAP